MSIYTNDQIFEDNEITREKKLRDLSESLEIKAHALNRVLSQTGAISVS